jgi:DNA polymerase III alpha subunit (gram-positive type)
MEIPITFVDTETTGLSWEENELIELAAIRTVVVDNKYIQKISTCSNKVLPKNPPSPRVARINHYDSTIWTKRAVPLCVALGNVFDLMEGSWHAGSNPIFDERFLKKAGKSLGWEYPKLISHHLLDVTTLSFKPYLEGKIKNLRQCVLAPYYNLGETQHSALQDVQQCIKLFAATLNLEIKD